MTWLAVDRDGGEHMFRCKPYRFDLAWKWLVHPEDIIFKEVNSK